MEKVPLNQLYKQAKTFEDYPLVKNTYDELTNFNIKHNFIKKWDDGGITVKGRRYDNAILFHSGPDFKDKIVCELGARDGLFSSWLTNIVNKVYVSDYFEEWGKGTEYDLGQIDYWKKMWESTASCPEKLVVEHQDITKLTYPDNMFDIVICTSVIEHLFSQNEWMGDMTAIREIVRITKPGGYILLSTDMTSGKSKWHSGTFYYNEIDLFDRLIRPSKCELVGNYDFNFNDPNNTDIHYVDGVGMCSSVVFTLRKY